MIASLRIEMIEDDGRGRDTRLRRGVRGHVMNNNWDS
jgi:hypothetical protein